MVICNRCPNLSYTRDRGEELCRDCLNRKCNIIGKGLMKPSDIPLTGMPLATVFGRLELEAAATMMVRTMQLKGDQFKKVSSKDINQTVWHDAGRKIEPLCSLIHNPFWYPDYRELHAEGFAELDIEADTIEFTKKGLEALSSLLT